MTFLLRKEEVRGMNQNGRDDLAIYLGLQEFEVTLVEVETSRRRGRIKVVSVARRSGTHRCPGCGREHATGLFEEAEAIRLRDNSIGDFESYLESEPMRVACCGGTRVERLPFVMPGFRMTRRFFERIAALCTRLPIAVVAQMAKLSWATVAKVDGRAIELGLGDRALDLTKLRWIGVQKWLLLSARENLEPKHKRLLDELMEHNQPLYQAYLLKEQLRAVLRYPWKYLGVLRDRLHEWILEVFDTALPELVRVAHRLADHLDAVIAGHEHDVPLGLCESINSKIRVLR